MATEGYNHDIHRVNYFYDHSENLKFITIFFSVLENWNFRIGSCWENELNDSVSCHPLPQGFITQVDPLGYDDITKKEHPFLQLGSKTKQLNEWWVIMLIFSKIVDSRIEK